VTGEFTKDMILQSAHEVDTRELADELELTARREQKGKECHRWGCGIITIALTGLGISLGVVFGTRNPGIRTTVPTVSPSTSPSAVPSSAPTGHSDLLFDDLPDYTQESLQNSSTPQWNSWDWLSNHQNITRLPEWRKKQLFALATFFSAFEGEHWNKPIRERWMDDIVDECLWFSSDLGLVVGGDFVEWQIYLGGFIPTETGNNKGEFKHLNMQDLQLSGFAPSIPPEISLLHSMSVIMLSANAFDGHLNDMIPAELFAMTNITNLYLDTNNLTGLLPTELGRMTILEVLNLDSNSFSGSLCSELGEMNSW
jgi:hypothetical protein